jgi:hypothetical protein
MTGANIGSLFSNHSSILYYQIGTNQFSGSLPYGPWPLLFAYFHGEIPLLFQHTYDLHFFEIVDNVLSETFPRWLGVGPILSYLNMSNNAFSGNLYGNHSNYLS